MIPPAALNHRPPEVEREKHWSAPDDPFKLAFEELVRIHRQSPYG